MELVGIIISIVALVLAGFTYVKHDRKLNKQAELINKYQLESMEKERENSKKAIIETNVIRGDKGKRTIKVYNKGLAKALNVNVKFLSADKVSIINNPCPIDINPKNGIDIQVAVSLESPEKITLELQWGDNYKKDNIEQQTIPIL